METTAVQSGAIFVLPEDVLVAIFTRVLWPYSNKISPIRLSQVCSYWRTVVRGCAKLWSTLELGRDKEAKELVALSQGASLSVFCRWRPKRGQDVHKRDWIWPSASRFCRLFLKGPFYLVAHALERVGNELPVLRSLEVTCLSHHTPPIRQKLPRVELPQELPRLFRLQLQ